jgi:hypothetical protein
MSFRRTLERSELAKDLGELRARRRARRHEGLGSGPVSQAIAEGRPDQAVALMVGGDPADDVDWDAVPMAVLHQVRLAAHRRRVSAEVPAVPARWTGPAHELRRDGITRLDGLLDAEALETMRDDFDRFVRHLEQRLRHGEGIHRGYHEREHYWPDDGAYITNDALAWSPSLVALACAPDVVALVADHLGRRPVIQRALGMRYLPQSPGVEDTQFRWHHDLEDRRCKLMVLLTDVGTDDQPMRYLPGSHDARHSLQRFRDNALGTRYRRRIVGPGTVEHRATGAAGDGIVFNSNGAHAATRSERGALRDVFIVEYGPPGGSIFGGRPHPDGLARVDAADRGPIQAMLDTVPAWDLPVPPAPLWVTHLRDLDHWLPVAPGTMNG